MASMQLRRRIAAIAFGFVALPVLAAAQGVRVDGNWQVPNFGVTTSLGLSSTATMCWTSGADPRGTCDLILARDAAGILAQRNGTNAQLVNIYNTYTSASNNEKLEIGVSADSGANVFGLLTTKTGAGTVRAMSIGTMGSATLNFVINGGLAWSLNTSGYLMAGTDNTVDIGATGATRPRSIYLASPAITVGSGTGVTVNNTSEVRTVVYKLTVLSTQFIAAAVTADFTIATLPAKTKVLNVVADLTTAFACSVTCTSATLSVTVGSAAGGNDLLVSFDADAAAARFGLADADLGTGINRANAVQGGRVLSWTGTTPVSMRLTSGTGNIGTGAATNLSQGTITFYITTELQP